VNDDREASRQSPRPGHVMAEKLSIIRRQSLRASDCELPLLNHSPDFSQTSNDVRPALATELRNIHTHNRGIVNEIFLKRVGQKKYGDFDFTLDETTRVDFEKFVILSRNAIDVAMRLDANLGKKFGVRRMAYSKRLSAKSESGNTERR
jgi:hypothetical protein